MDTCETVRVVDEDSPQGFIVINKEDKTDSHKIYKGEDPVDDETGDISTFKKAELVAYAKENGLEIDESANKADILAAIKDQQD